MGQKGLSDTRIHQVELLVTLNYLLNYTDEDHPAKQTDICKYAAEKYKLKYDPKKQAGNDIKRQRIGECLNFLRELSMRFPNDVPFSLELTDGNKYYLEYKYDLTEEQIVKILAAIKNDKYTRDEDTNLLTEKLLVLLSSQHNRERYIKEANDMTRGVKKHSSVLAAKLKLVERAFNEKKLLHINLDILDTDKKTTCRYHFYYRVYKIFEYRGKPLALLVPIDKKFLFTGVRIDPIEFLDINMEEPLIDEFDPKRDLDAQYRRVDPELAKEYPNLEDLVKYGAPAPYSFGAFKVSFAFRYGMLKYIKSSFENHFGKKLPYTVCKSYDTVENIDKSFTSDEYYIKPIPGPLDKEHPGWNYCVVNTILSYGAFRSWLLSDVHGDGRLGIFGCLNIEGPSYIVPSILDFNVKEIIKHKDKLSPEDIKKIKQLAEEL